MKRILLTILSFLFFACISAQTTHSKGVKVDNTPEVNSITVPQMLSLIDTGDDNLMKRISLVNLVSQLNLATGNLTQEEVEDILGNAIVSGTHSNGSFVYNDASGTIDFTGTTAGDGNDNDYPTAANISGNTLTLTIPNQADVTADLSPYLDNTDSQTITDFSLSGNILSITLSGGNTETVDVSTLVGGGGSDGNDFPTAASLVGNTLTITIPGQTDVTVDLSNLLPTDVVATASDSPVQNIEHWIGTIADFNNRTPLPNVHYTITDSIPPTPINITATSGTFTPTVVDGNDTNYVVDNINCSYYMIGRLVYFRMSLRASFSGTPSGVFKIKGLPVAIFQTAGTNFPCDFSFMGSPARDFDDIVCVASGTNDLVFKVHNNGDGSYLNWSEVTGSTALTVHVSGTYLTSPN